MSLYRASPKDGVAWITGASTGIGRGLARQLAAEGYTVAATARDEDRLATLIEETAGLPGKILSFPCDVTDEEGMRRTAAEIERRAGPVALAVFNAGNYFPTRGERLEVLNIVKTYEINLFGVLYGLVPAVEYMCSRGFGHVVVVGSASAFFGWPSAAAYGSSKAALNNLAEALKHDFDRLNIRLQVVNPGFIDTPLTRSNQFSMPALMSVDAAVARFSAGLKTGGFEVAFPRRFIWGLKVLRMLPFRLRFLLIHRITGWNRKPMANPRKPRR